MKIQTVIDTLRSIKGLTSEQRSARAWAIATLYLREEQERATSKQERATPLESTEPRENNEIQTRYKGFHAAIVKAHEAVSERRRIDVNIPPRAE